MSRAAITLVRIVVAAVMVPSVAACADGEPRTAPDIVRFGVIQAVDLLPYFVMRDEGFAEERSLRLEGEVVAGGRAALEAMRAGTLDASVVGGAPWLSAARAGHVPQDFVAVGANAFADTDHLAIAVLARPEVTSWADLGGRGIAVNQIGSISEVAVRVRLAHEGVTGVQLTEIPFPNQGLAVAGGNVAAAVLVEPYLTQSVLRGDGHVLDWIVGDEPFPEFEESLVVFRRGFLDERPDVVRRFLDAQLDAVDWIARNERAARLVLTRNLGVSTEVGARVHLLRFPLDLRNDPDTLATMQATLAEYDPSLRPLPLEELFDETLLDEVLAGRR